MRVGGANTVALSDEVELPTRRVLTRTLRVAAEMHDEHERLMRNADFLCLARKRWTPTARGGSDNQPV